MSDVRIVDTTLREHELGVLLDAQEFLAIAQQLQLLGVDVLEIGSPFVSSDVMEEEVLGTGERFYPESLRYEPVIPLQQLEQTLTNTLLSVCLPLEEDVIHHVRQALRDPSRVRLNVMLPASSDREIPSGRTLIILEEASEHFAEVALTIEDTFAMSGDGLIELAQSAVSAGVKTICVADTTGRILPEQFGTIVKYLRRQVPGNFAIAAYAANDMGLATANVLAGIEAGANEASCSINGLGPRAGVAALEQVATILAEYGHGIAHIETNIRRDELARTSRFVSRITGREVSSDRPVVGRDIAGSGPASTRSICTAINTDGP